MNEKKTMEKDLKILIVEDNKEYLENCELEEIMKKYRKEKLESNLELDISEGTATYANKIFKVDGKEFGLVVLQYKDSVVNSNEYSPTGKREKATKRIEIYALEKENREAQLLFEKNIYMPAKYSKEFEKGFEITEEYLTPHGSINNSKSWIDIYFPEEEEIKIIEKSIFIPLKLDYVVRLQTDYNNKGYLNMWGYLWNNKRTASKEKINLEYKLK